MIDTSGRTDASEGPLGAAVTIAELEDDPHPVLARLRAAEPVSWLPVFEGWLVTRYDVASAVMRDAATFTVDDPGFSTARVIGPSMLSLDGAEHVRHREPFAAPFRPADVERRFTGVVERETARLIAALPATGSADLRAAVAAPLAVAVVAESLGLAGTDTAAVLRWYAAIVGAVSDITEGLPPRAAASEAFAALSAHVAGADGTSPLAVATADGRLSPAEAASNAAVLMFGGIETTEAMIINTLFHLLGSAEQLAAVRADPALVPDAVEESLRLEPAASVVDRYATRDVDLGGAAIRRGDLVRVSLAGANRDPAVFADPDRFDVRRDARPQLAFARGPHFCLGAHLARLETCVAVGRLLDALPGLRFDPDRPAAPRGLVFRKPAALHVCWDTRA